eukprot:5511784-Lingulodinium_polyedra.AAC.1
MPPTNEYAARVRLRPKCPSPKSSNESANQRCGEGRTDNQGTSLRAIHEHVLGGKDGTHQTARYIGNRVKQRPNPHGVAPSLLRLTLAPTI